jgi:hypothetical protein
MFAGYPKAYWRLCTIHAQLRPHVTDSGHGRPSSCSLRDSGQRFKCYQPSQHTPHSLVCRVLPWGLIHENSSENGSKVDNCPFASMR